MLTVKGRVMNVFHVPAKTMRDGEIREPFSKVQLMGETPLQTGGVQLEMLDLKTDRGTAFEAAKGRVVECAVRPYAFAGETGNVMGGVSLVKGAEIILLNDKGEREGVLSADGPRNQQRKAG